jgi:PD-(D/E)XK nuclease superfamily
MMPALRSDGTEMRQMSTGSGDVLSPSQVRTFLDCPVRWEFKYRRRLPDPQTSNLALGKAVHAALGENFRQKIETREDLPTTGVMALFRQAWIEERDETEFAESDDADVIGKCGEALVMRYMDEMAPFIQPAASDFFVAGEIGGIRVQGIIDVVDEDQRIIDLKTRTRRPPHISFADVFQVATYRQLLPTADGCVHIDSLIKTKSVQVVRQSLDLTPEDLRITVMLYPLVREAMQTNAFLPNRLSLSCSRRHCAFWRQCEREFGGHVRNV